MPQEQNENVRDDSDSPAGRRNTHPSSPGGYAIASFILGILSFVTCGPFAGIPAFIFGMIELRNIRNHVAPPEGRPFALAGAILGGINSAFVILAVLLYLLFILLMFIMGVHESYSFLPAS
jgi:hypothetical protein